MVVEGLLAGFALVLGVALGRYVWPALRPGDAAAFARAQDDAARLDGECRALRERVAALEAAERAAIDRTARLEARDAALTAEFETIANRILKANAAELSENSKSAVELVLAPLKERLQDFQNRVESTYDSERREVLSLKEQIRQLVETSQAVGSQADSLAQALRGQSQLRGRWGELVLERILETAGLSEGREYIVQGRGLGLRSETGGLQRPDVLINLPQGRVMVIDAKLSLTGYERLAAAGAEEEATAAAQFLRDVKAHIDGLAGKRYQDNDKLIAHDCVLMFVPIEGALAAALSRDPELFGYAWKRRVVLVGPSTLLMTLQTVASIWQYELRGQKAQEIARLAGELVDKVALSLVDLNTVADKMAAAAEAHNAAVKRLSTGRGNALSIGERIRTMGVKSRHAMPAMLIDGVAVAAEADEAADEAADD
jgi:DNA recombination protein RmuC